MLDNLLGLITQIAWALFTIFVIIFFIQTVRRHGVVLALIRLFSFRVMLPLLLVIGITLLSLALVFIEPQEVAVVVSVLSPSGIRPQPLRAGLHWIIPILEHEIRYPIFEQTYTMSAKPLEGDKPGDDSIRARTNDGQEVRLDCSVMLRIDADQAISVHINWQSRYMADFVRPEIRSAVRAKVSQFNVQEINSSKRQDLEDQLDQVLRDAFAAQGLILDQFLLRDVTFTPEYASSIEHKQIALEGVAQSKHEAEQMQERAKGKATAVAIEAQAQSEALQKIATALNQNPNLLTYQYIDKLSPNIRVMLVPNNAPLILPLPTLDALEPPTRTSVVTPTLMATPIPPYSGN